MKPSREGGICRWRRRSVLYPISPDVSKLIRWYIDLYIYPTNERAVLHGNPGVLSSSSFAHGRVTTRTEETSILRVSVLRTCAFPVGPIPLRDATKYPQSSANGLEIERLFCILFATTWYPHDKYQVSTIRTVEEELTSGRCNFDLPRRLVYSTRSKLDVSWSEKNNLVCLYICQRIYSIAPTITKIYHWLRYIGQW